MHTQLTHGFYTGLNPQPHDYLPRISITDVNWARSGSCVLLPTLLSVYPCLQLHVWCSPLAPRLAADCVQDSRPSLAVYLVLLLPTFASSVTLSLEDLSSHLKTSDEGRDREIFALSLLPPLGRTVHSSIYTQRRQGEFCFLSYELNVLKIESMIYMQHTQQCFEIGQFHANRSLEDKIKSEPILKGDCTISKIKI